MNLPFHEDSHIAEIAAAYAADALELSATQFGVKLDFREDSIADVETVLGRIHESLQVRRPQEDRIWRFAKTFGSYIGEVFRRAHTGHWGMVMDGGKKAPGMRCAPRDLTFSPWTRAHHRIVRGPGENIWEYYQSLRAGK